MMTEKKLTSIESHLKPQHSNGDKNFQVLKNSTKNFDSFVVVVVFCFFVDRYSVRFRYRCVIVIVNLYE